ncbi:MAG: hypothetical protein E6G31_09405 [Actinobacteria bacterium]|nr:MAG: hypothetical protein E6G31_09405 [Actinomycetota bacterium]
MVELLFMMVILKLPILYLAGVCYWAVKAEPKPLEGARVTVPREPGPRRPPRPRAHRPRSPRGGPDRRDVRVARAPRSRRHA